MNTKNIAEIIEDLEYKDLFCVYDQNSMTAANNYLHNMIYTTYITEETTYEDLLEYVRQVKSYIDVNTVDMYNVDSNESFLELALSYCDNDELIKLLHTELDFIIDNSTIEELKKLENEEKINKNSNKAARTYINKVLKK